MDEPTALRDPEVALAIAYAPAFARPGLRLLWTLDEALAAMVAAAREPMLGQIRLAWWRDELARLGSAPLPADPLLARLAAEVAPLAPDGALAPIAEAWALLLDGAGPDAALLDAHAEQRGAALFAAAATVLGGPAIPAVIEGGAVWALVDLARRGIGVDALAAAANRQGVLDSTAWPRALRPLGMLVALAAADARAGAIGAQGSPRRLLRMLGHRITGRLGVGPPAR